MDHRRRRDNRACRLFRNSSARRQKTPDRLIPVFRPLSKTLKNLKKHLDKFRKCGILISRDAELCNGSTTDSDSVCWGSNPYSAAKNHRTPCAPDDFLCIWKRDSNKEGSKMKKACYAFFIAAKPPKARSVRSGACRRA